MKSANLLTCIAAAVTIGLVGGCAVGPDFQRPTGPGVSAYTPTPLPPHTVEAPAATGESQRFVAGGAVERQWWRALGSPRLDALVDRALQANPTLAAARATLRQAEEVYAARSGSTLYPQVDANLGGQRQRFDPGASGQAGAAREFSLYHAGVDVRYTFDAAGGNRRALEALAARVDQQRFQVEGARLTLAANIVTTAVTEARLAAQVEVTEAILASQESQLRLTRERLRLGQAAPDEVLALQTQVEQTRAGIPLLRQQRQQNEHLLAVLVGQAPGSGGLPAIAMAELTLPVDLPLAVPSELVRLRPDIQAAEAMLQAANAEYGVAVAKLYPQLNLSANLGSQSLTTGALFGSGSAIWNLVGQLTQPLFNPGLPAEKRAALAAFEAAAANYRVVVLEALRNVADVLRALDNDAQRLAALAVADAAARGFLASIERRYGLGAASYVELLIARQQAQQTSLTLIEARAARLVDSAAFYQAMGGGMLNAAGTVARSSPTDGL